MWRIAIRLAVAGWMLALSGTARPAAACLMCSSDMTCAWSQGGAAFCLGDGNLCMMAGKCGGLGSPYRDAALVQVTLLEATFSAPGPLATHVEHGAGLAIGRAAARLAGGVTGGLEPRIVYSAFGAGDRVTAAFGGRFGDGFTLRREGSGRGARVIVRALLNGRPGAVLADERVGEDDALVTRVSLAGRPLLLVVQAPTLSPAEAVERGRHMARDLEEARAGMVAPMRPPFELRVLDE